MSVALGIWSGEPVTVFFPPDSGVVTDPLACPDNAQELLDSLFQSPQYLPVPGSLDAEQDASPVYEELRRIPAGTVLKLYTYIHTYTHTHTHTHTYTHTHVCVYI
jgi:hypothetical protein